MWFVCVCVYAHVCALACMCVYVCNLLLSLYVHIVAIALYYISLNFYSTLRALLSAPGGKYIVCTNLIVLYAV